jgi:hypothetical protein
MTNTGIVAWVLLILVLYARRKALGLSFPRAIGGEIVRALVVTAVILAMTFGVLTYFPR